MCGLAGILSTRGFAEPASLEALGRMAAALRHRGPDELGLYRNPRLGLVHTRLSIVDVTAGQQPLCTEDGRLWIAFNGEIFNFVELREELLALGHRFRTRSDTEVAVHAYEAWGEEAFGRFNGQFAMAIWDERASRLVLARDRLGVRPLHLAEVSGRLFFASEVKAIFAGDPGIRRALDPMGLEETFTFWTVVAPQSMFQGVHELPPGHWRRYEPDGRVVERQFWRPSFPGEGEGRFEGSLDAAAERVVSALERAVRLRVTRSDVPVGSYLSGGLDSSLVAALGRKVAGGRFATFSIRFADRDYDETEYQREMASRLESEHHELLVSGRDIARVFPDVVRHAERPLLRTAPAPLFLLSGLAASHGTKVVLTGEGADEIFAGYDLFREAKVRRFWARDPRSRLRPLLLDRLYPYLARSPVAQRALAREFFGADLAGAGRPGFSHGPRWRSAAALQRLFSPELRRRTGRGEAVGRLLASLPPELSGWPSLAQDQYLEIRTLLSGYLLSSQGDRMLMAHSVEGRFPFLDRELVDLACSLPSRHKLLGLDEKHVLKRAARGLVPDRIRARPKQPYRAPNALAFTGPNAADWVAELLRPAAVAEASVFDPGAVERLWAKCRAAAPESRLSNADDMALVGVLSTQLLHHELVRRPPEREPAGPFQTVVDRLAR